MNAMRRMLHGFSLALVVASSALIAAGCGGINSLIPSGLIPSGSGATSPFIGLWTLSSITINGVSGNCPGTVTSGGASYPCEAIVRAFIAGGTFNDTSPADQVGSGSWNVTGTGLASTLTITKNGAVSEGTVSFSADASAFVFTTPAPNVESFTWTKS